MHAVALIEVALSAVKRRWLLRRNVQRSVMEINMGLISCPECNKDISDNAPSCIHCGYPIANPISSIPGDPLNSSSSEFTIGGAEKSINSAVDIIFALIYLYILYMIFISKELGDVSGGAELFGMFLFFVFLYFIQKMVKAILGTIGRAFDSMFSKYK